jgi:hypothetical protein
VRLNIAGAVIYYCYATSRFACMTVLEREHVNAGGSAADDRSEKRDDGHEGRRRRTTRSIRWPQHG